MRPSCQRHADDAVVCTTSWAGGVKRSSVRNATNDLNEYISLDGLHRFVRESSCIVVLYSAFYFFIFLTLQIFGGKAGEPISPSIARERERERERSINIKEEFELQNARFQLEKEVRETRLRNEMAERMAILQLLRHLNKLDYIFK